MNHAHQILIAVLIVSLLLISGLQRVRFLAPILNFGVLLGLAAGVAATALYVHAA